MATDYAGNVADTLPGANQFLTPGTKYGPNVTSRSNRVQAGRLPSPMSRPVGIPSQAHPLGLTQND